MKKEQTVERYQPTENIGLTANQVELRYKSKLTNAMKVKSGKSYISIIFSNIFTYFNLIWALIFISLAAVRAKWGDMVFVLPILANTIISIIQECRAKHTVNKLTLITAPRIKVIRDGKEQEVFTEKLVLDDVIRLEVGNQIPADCVVLSGNIEVNESLLTGESKPVIKTEKNEIFGGSFIVSGACFARVDKIGKDCFAQKLATEAKKYKKQRSNLLKDLNKIIKYIGIIIIPIGALLFICNYFNVGKDLPITVALTAGSLTGMIPAGMFLLITIALAVGVIKLSRKKTLVQDIYSIEMLARTNMLCLDKTGTLTDGTMAVTQVITIDESINIKEVVPAMLYAQPVANVTAKALESYFGKQEGEKVYKNIAFSSKRKFFACQFKNETYAIGAPEFVLDKVPSSLARQINELASCGQRVLLMAHSQDKITGQSIPTNLKPVALIAIEDHIREDASETISWFRNNGVGIKIISGDNPATVGYIAERVGVPNATKFISLEGKSLEEVASIADKYTVFGRVSPEQKHILIKTLKSLGYVVGMTGDGVNDTLALKEADCSIAMADGSEVARNISHLVLLDSKFSSLPAVVKEGRQVVNNVQRASTLFLMKTFFAISISLILLIIWQPSLLTSGQLVPLEVLVIGLPSVFLALEPHSEEIKGNFIQMVIKRAIPYGVLILVNIVVIEALALIPSLMNVVEVKTLLTLTLTTTGFINLCKIASPFNKIRFTCCGISFVGILTMVILSFCIPSIGFNFGIQEMGWTSGIVFVCLVVASILAVTLTPVITKNYKRKKKKTGKSYKIKKFR